MDEINQGQINAINEQINRLRTEINYLNNQLQNSINAMQASRLSGQAFAERQADQVYIQNQIIARQNVIGQYQRQIQTLGGSIATPAPTPGPEQEQPIEPAPVSGPGAEQPIEPARVSGPEQEQPIEPAPVSGPGAEQPIEPAPDSGLGAEQPIEPAPEPGPGAEQPIEFGPTKDRRPDIDKITEQSIDSKPNPMPGMEKIEPKNTETPVESGSTPDLNPETEHDKGNNDGEDKTDKIEEINKEIAKLEQEIAVLNNQLTSINNIIGNTAFMTQATVERQADRVYTENQIKLRQSRIRQLKEQLANLGIDSQSAEDISQQQEDTGTVKSGEDKGSDPLAKQKAELDKLKSELQQLEERRKQMILDMNKAMQNNDKELYLKCRDEIKKLTDDIEKKSRIIKEKEDTIKAIENVANMETEQPTPTVQTQQQERGESSVGNPEITPNGIPTMQGPQSSNVPQGNETVPQVPVMQGETDSQDIHPVDVKKESGLKRFFKNIIEKIASIFRRKDKAKTEEKTSQPGITTPMQSTRSGTDRPVIPRQMNVPGVEQTRNGIVVHNPQQVLTSEPHQTNPGRVKVIVEGKGRNNIVETSVPLPGADEER